MPPITKRIAPNATLEQILDLYPQFLDNNPGSVHYRYHQVLSTALHKLKRNIKLVKLSNNLDRPLKIWREQKEPYKYVTHYSVELENIKQVRLYQERPKTLLKDSGPLSPGTNKYRSSYKTQSKEIIPTTRYYLEVETYEGFTFQKGFPENDTTKGDIYDHDNALDNIGRLHGLKRHQYKKTVPSEYNFTYPTYNNSGSEWDACYQKRIEKYLQDYHQKPFPVLEFETRYMTKPIITNAGDNLIYMDETSIESPNHYMATPDFNPNVYHLDPNIYGIPSNIRLPSLKELETLAKHTFPLSSQVIINLKTPKSKIENYELKTEKEETITTLFFEFTENIAPPIQYYESHFAYMDESKMDAVTSKITSAKTAKDLIECQKMQRVTIQTIVKEVQETISETPIPPTILTPPTLSQDNKTTYTLDLSQGEHKGTQVIDGCLTADDKVYESVQSAGKIQEESPKITNEFTGHWENLTSIYKEGASWRFGYEDQTAWLQGHQFNHQIPLEAKIEHITMKLERSKVIGNYEYTCKLIIPDPCKNNTPQEHLKRPIQKTCYGDDDSEYLDIEETWTIPQIQPIQINHPDFGVGFQTIKDEKSNKITCRNLKTHISWTWKLKHYTIPLSLPGNSKWETLNIQSTIPHGNIVKYNIIYPKSTQEGQLENGENKIILSSEINSNLTLLLQFEGESNTAQIEKIEYTIKNG